ncbi:MAG: HAD hydrolase-like protein [Candidatus Nanoarchaeia archaeon]|nr:HAD hydrolase-like protein [Candidatus Nanoarchaeia archaeon]
MVGAYVFDFDGVINDSLDLVYYFNKIIDPDLTLEQYKKRFEGNLYSSTDVTPEKILQYFQLKGDATEKSLLKPHIKEILIELSKNAPLFIITSDRTPAVQKYFQNHGIAQIITQIYGVEIHHSKEIKFSMLFKDHNLTKEECLFVTDTLGDILEAHKVGVKTIGVTEFGFHDALTLQKGNPYKIISKLEELLYF